MFEGLAISMLANTVMMINGVRRDRKLRPLANLIPDGKMLKIAASSWNERFEPIYSPTTTPQD